MHASRRLFGVGICVFSLCVSSVAHALTWTDHYALTEMKLRSWEDIASSDDGVKLIASDDSVGVVNVSLDGGDTWNSLGSLRARGDDFDRVAISGDGSTMAVASTFAGEPTARYVLVSTDDGATWTTGAGSGPYQWGSVTISQDGTKMAAARSNGKIFTSTDTGATWTEQAGSATTTWFMIRGSNDGTKLAAVANSGSVYTSSDSGVTWVEHVVPGPTSLRALGVSSDGNEIVAGDYGGDIYTSTDFGDNWTLRDFAIGWGWRSLAVSDDAEIIIAGAYGDQIHISTDGGATWDIQTELPDENWISMTASADGTTLFAAGRGSETPIYRTTDTGATWATSTMRLPANDIWGLAISSDGSRLVTGSSYEDEYWGGGLYTSADSASTWTERLPYSPGYWRFAASGDGSVLAVADVSGYIFISTDSGATWATSTAAGSRSWRGIAMSDDGQSIAAVVLNGHVYTSVDGGTNWTDQASLGNRAWSWISSSDDGAVLAAAVNTGYIYLSNDGGATWATSTAAGSRAWVSVDMSSDGTVLAAVPGSGYPYISTDSGATWATSTAAGSGSWSTIAISANGNTLLAGGFSGLVKVSNDTGTTWDDQPFASYPAYYDFDFDAAAVSDDGSKLYIVEGLPGAVWSATQGVVNNAPDTPTSLGATAYVNGSTGSDTTPDLTFTLSDPDGADTLRFHIVIDDTSDFSSPVVEYHSALAAQGSRTFTLGQAVGSGNYVTGSSGQTLSDGSYYWRVRASDGSATSSYASGNGGAVAFVIDTSSSVGSGSSGGGIKISLSKLFGIGDDDEGVASSTEEEDDSLLDSILDIFGNNDAVVSPPANPPAGDVQAPTGGGGATQKGAGNGNGGGGTTTPPNIPQQPTSLIPSGIGEITRSIPEGFIFMGDMRSLLASYLGFARERPVETGMGAIALASILRLLQYLVTAIGTYLRTRTLSDIPYSIRAAFHRLLALLGIRKPRREWGTVYDAESKQPLDPALVELVNADTQEVVEQSFTDMEGKYGFLDRVGKFFIRARKTHYQFPSVRVVGTTDSIFDSVYHGEIFGVDGTVNAFAPNIPMDALEKDWNQEEKRRMGIGGHRFVFDRTVLVLSEILFWAGFLFMCIIFTVDPIIVNAAFVAFYFLIGWITRHIPRPRLWGRIVSAIPEGGYALELAHPQIPDVVIGRATTDIQGRFFLKAAPGDYVLTIIAIHEGIRSIIRKREVRIGKKMVLNSDVEV